MPAIPDRPDDVPVHLDHLSALLAGYESLRPLSQAETAALAPMTALCHAEFALSEADYFLGILHPEAKAPMAYDGWLVGHARWFHSGAGRSLLNALRKGRPGYAAVDVYEQEPIVNGDHPFLSMPNVLCTPHLGWAEWTNFELYFREAFEQIVLFEQGGPLRLANPDVVSRRKRSRS